ncbi:type II toxin-antitoxin system RelE/ParE family toxin [Rahnella victoriana]|uniref:Type II toxin-antitoxin system RelE/ParE family toxin n=1 Tax=Rahnella victoriana TaxID=1510570 RepID=A0ABS0DPB5_9GAMM|nr:type II toxin-antitoxin system RelE/ParE family toxin [Rahnella victoriana]MBF7955741.1 type II toxin-antitoxin system RelE/ParE family toxin [Rahnella victoriana]
MYDVTILPAAKKALLKLPMTLYAAVVDALEELEVCGADLKEPLVRYVGNGLREIRVTSLDGLGRAFYFFMKGRRIYVVHILHKKTDKTPPQDLDLAVKRMKTIKRNEV